MAGTEQAGTGAARVDWRRVGWYYGIALGGGIIVATALRLLLDRYGVAANPWVFVGTALLYMPLPMVAGLIAERGEGRVPLIKREWRTLRHGFWRRYGRSLLWAGVAIIAILVVGLLVAWLAGVAGVPGAGHLVLDEASLQQRLRELSPGLSDQAALPSPAVLVALTAIEGLLAGATINGLFAIGEEYGWRGVLADELRPLDGWRAPALTGVLWGLWHAPIIIALGHNYGSEWGWGILVMVTWTVPFSFILTRLRDRTSTVLAPAVLHGAFNGVAGLFALLVADGNVLVALPVGVLLAVVLAVVAVAVWWLVPARSVRPRAGDS